MRGYDHFRLQRDVGIELFQAALRGAMAVIGPDIRMAVLVTCERRMQHTFLRKPYSDVAWIVFVVDIEELNLLSPQMQGHVIAKARHGIDWIDVLQRLGAFGKTLAPGIDLVGLHL